MTVSISNNSSRNFRSELTSLKGKVNKLLAGGRIQEFWFSNLVTNGTFDSTTDGWNAANGSIAIVSSTIEFTASSAGSILYSDNVSVSKGKRYFFSFDAKRGSISALAYSVRDQTNGTDIIPSTAYTVGTSTLETVSVPVITVGNYSEVRLYVVRDPAASSGTAYFDNISLFEVDADDEVIYTLPPDWKPRFVFEDGGSIQREGAAYDYTVEYNGTYYYVKPTVQPTAGSAAWCVIGEAI